MADLAPAITLEQAVAELIGQPEDSPPAPEQTEQSAPVESAEGEHPDGAEETAAEDAADEEHPEDDESEDSDDAETGEAYGIEAEDTYVINGEEVSGEELIKGYQRNIDYTHKTQALADERKQVAEEAVIINTERQAVSEMLPKMQQYEQAQQHALNVTQQLSQGLQNMNAEQQQIAQWVIQQIQGGYQQAQQNLTGMNEAVAAAGKARQKESLLKLKQYNPDWGPKQYSNVKKHALEHFGYSAQEIDKADDWRFMQALAESAELRALKSQAKSAPAPKDPAPIKAKKVKPVSAKKQKAAKDWNRATKQVGVHSQLDAFADALVSEAQSKSKR